MFGGGFGVEIGGVNGVSDWGYDGGFDELCLYELLL